MFCVRCPVEDRFVNPLFEVFDAEEFVLTSYRDVEANGAEMSVYFADGSAAPRARAALVRAGELLGLSLDPALREFPDEDWTLAYRRHFAIDVISPRLAIVPAWEVEAAKARADLPPTRLVMDPGMAFGTGRHATTRACLAFVDRLAAEDPDRSFLDVGCGSGILAVAAALVGFREIAGFDVDPDAVKTANETAARNGVRVTFVRGDLCRKSTLPGVRTDAGGVYDVVAANVLGPVLIRYAREIAATVRRGPRSRLILSGILEEVYPDVRAAYAELGFAELGTILDGEWRTGLFSAPETC